MATSITKLASFWIVGQKSPCLLCTPIRYEGKAGVQFGFELSGLNNPNIFFMRPLFLQILGEISLGTNTKERVLKDAEVEMRSCFHASRMVACFASGPLTAFFSYHASKEAQECLKCIRDEPKPEVKSKALEVPVPRFTALVFARNNMRQRLRWELQSRAVLKELRTAGIPFLRFNTYFQLTEARHVRTF